MLKCLIIVLSLSLIITVVAYAEECPTNFSEILEGNDATNYYKRHIVSLCYGKLIIIKGKVINIDSKHDYKGNLKGYEIDIRSIPNDVWYEVTMEKKPGCDLLSIKKDSIITIESKLTEFRGAMNRYLLAIDGVCK